MDDSGEEKKKFSAGSIAFWVALLAVVGYFVVPGIINPPADPYRDGLKDPESALRLYQNTAYRFTKMQEGVGFMEMEKVVPESDWAWYEANYSTLGDYGFAGGLQDEVLSAVDPTVGTAIDKRLSLNMLIEAGCYEPSSEIMAREIGPTEATFVCRTKSLESRSDTDWRVKVVFDGKYWKVQGFALGQANLTGNVTKGDITTSAWDTNADKMTQAATDMGGVAASDTIKKSEAASEEEESEESGNPLDMLGSAPKEAGNPLDALTESAGDDTADSKDVANASADPFNLDEAVENEAPAEAEPASDSKSNSREVASARPSDKYSSLDGLKVTDPKDPFERSGAKSSTTLAKPVAEKGESNPLDALAGLTDSAASETSKPDMTETAPAKSEKATDKAEPLPSADSAEPQNASSLSAVIADDSLADAGPSDSDPFGLGSSAEEAPAKPAESLAELMANRDKNEKIDPAEMRRLFLEEAAKQQKPKLPGAKNATVKTPPAAKSSPKVPAAESLEPAVDEAESESAWGDLDDSADAESAKASPKASKSDVTSADPFGEDSPTAKPAAGPKAAPATKAAPAKPAAKPSTKSDPGSILGGAPTRVDPTLLAPADALITQAAKDWGAGKFKQSVASAEKALAIYRRNLPEEHPKITKVKKMIEDAKAKAGE